VARDVRRERVRRGGRDAEAAQQVQAVQHGHQQALHLLIRQRPRVQRPRAQQRGVARGRCVQRRQRARVRVADGGVQRGGGVREVQDAEGVVGAAQRAHVLLAAGGAHALSADADATAAAAAAHGEGAAHEDGAAHGVAQLAQRGAAGRARAARGGREVQLHEADDDRASVELRCERARGGQAARDGRLPVIARRQAAGQLRAVQQRDARAAGVAHARDGRRGAAAERREAADARRQRGAQRALIRALRRRHLAQRHHLGGGAFRKGRQRGAERSGKERARRVHTRAQDGALAARRRQARAQRIQRARVLRRRGAELHAVQLRAGGWPRARDSARQQQHAQRLRNGAPRGAQRQRARGVAGARLHQVIQRQQGGDDEDDARVGIQQRVGAAAERALAHARQPSLRRAARARQRGRARVHAVRRQQRRNGVRGRVGEAPHEGRGERGQRAQRSRVRAVASRQRPLRRRGGQRARQEHAGAQRLRAAGACR
jgi:hypothetical protein